MVQALVETVVVPETWFYRDADAFRALERLAHERLDERGTALPLRILSLPCSTDEEPCTIAMTLLDATHMRIDAMDISERAMLEAGRHSMEAVAAETGFHRYRTDAARLSARVRPAAASNQTRSARVVTDVVDNIADSTSPLIQTAP